MKAKNIYWGRMILLSSLLLVAAVLGFRHIETTTAQGATDLIRAEIPAEAISIDMTQLEEIATRKRAGNSKLEQRLVELIEWHNVDGDRSMPHAPAGLILDGVRVLVEIRADPEIPQLTSQLLTMEGAIIRHHNAPGLYEAWVEIASLENLTGYEEIYFIQPVRLAQTMAGDSVSQGVARSFADEWHAAGITGRGVTIAIIDIFDDTDGQIADLQASGDWPPAARLTTVKVGGGDFGDNGDPHGNAVLEIAYDMAPGAAFIAYDTLTVGDWYRAIGLAEAAGADIISASLGAPQDGIGDGSALRGSIAEAATDARNAGALYINAAGNYREDHWGGLYTPSSIPDFHEWGSGNNINQVPYCLPAGFTFSVDLFWDDWEDVDHDYDLVIFRLNANEEWMFYAGSFNEQNGSPGQTPQESVTVVASGESPNCDEVGLSSYAIVVSRHNAATDKNLQLFVNGLLSPSMVHTVPARSLSFPADSPNVVAVAAVHHDTLDQEPYSSEGPILAPGGGLPTGGEHPKPDIASYAGGIDTESYGPGNEPDSFSGTSAAAPHVAGWAALILQNNPSFDVDDLEDEMFDIAGSSTANYDNDLGDPGHNFQYGHGLARFLFTPTAVTLTAIGATPAASWPAFLLILMLAAGIMTVSTIVARRKETRSS